MMMVLHRIPSGGTLPGNKWFSGTNSLMALLLTKFCPYIK